MGKSSLTSCDPCAAGDKLKFVVLGTVNFSLPQTAVKSSPKAKGKFTRVSFDQGGTDDKLKENVNKPRKTIRQS